MKKSRAEEIWPEGDFKCSRVKGESGGDMQAISVTKMYVSEYHPTTFTSLVKPITLLLSARSGQRHVPRWFTESSPRPCDGVCVCVCARVRVCRTHDRDI
jgi:hypothetical protein